MTMLRILYAGDGDITGPARYLASILKYLKTQFVHLPPSDTLSERVLRKRYDAIILSDYSCRRASSNVQKIIARQMEDGAGLLMIGGWSSFTGFSGGWRDSMIEEILPVKCSLKDDRVNFPGGALVIKNKKSSFLRSLSFKNPPVICGLNAVTPKLTGRILLTAKKIMYHVPDTKNPIRLSLDPKDYPLLVLSSDSKMRAAALTTDLAPHWCGGLVDWGKKRMTLSAGKGIQTELGDQYVKFVSTLIQWLTRKSS